MIRKQSDVFVCRLNSNISLNSKSLRYSTLTTISGSRWCTGNGNVLRCAVVSDELWSSEGGYCSLCLEHVIGCMMISIIRTHICLCSFGCAFDISVLDTISKNDTRQTDPQKAFCFFFNVSISTNRLMFWMPHVREPCTIVQTRALKKALVTTTRSGLTNKRKAHTKMRTLLLAFCSVVVPSWLTTTVQAEPSYLRAKEIMAASPPVVSTHFVLERSLQDTDVTNEEHEEGEEGEEHHDDEEEEHHDDEEHYEGDGHDHENEEFTTTTVSSSSASSFSEKPWGQAIGFSLLVNIATLTGLLVLIPTLLAGAFCSQWTRPTKENSERTHYILHIIIPSFACGALLATTVFLLLPEAMLLMATATGAFDHGNHRRRRDLQGEVENGESVLAWKFGTSLLGGYLIPVILGSIFPHEHQEDVPECPVCEERNKNAVQVAVVVDKSEMSTEAGATTRFCAEDGCCSLHSEHPHEEEGTTVLMYI